LDNGWSAIETSEEEPDTNTALELDAMEERRDGEDENCCPGNTCTISPFEFGYKKNKNIVNSSAMIISRK